MAEFLPPPGLSLREEPLPGPEAGGGETEAELSLSLARIKTRTYGSTASVAAPLAERYLEHRLSPGDTLQGVALKYGVTVGRGPPGWEGAAACCLHFGPRPERAAAWPGLGGPRRSELLSLPRSSLRGHLSQPFRRPMRECL